MGMTGHVEPHMCPDCGFCWCGCDNCHTRLEQLCVCDECECDDRCSHYGCDIYQDMLISGEMQL